MCSECELVAVTNSAWTVQVLSPYWLFLNTSHLKTVCLRLCICLRASTGSESMLPFGGVDCSVNRNDDHYGNYSFPGMCIYNMCASVGTRRPECGDADDQIN